MLAAFNDPDGVRYGLPTFPWNGARNLDPKLATRKQLAQRGLRPGGQDPVAQLMWRSGRACARPTGGIRTALLYRIDLAKPKRPFSPAMAAAVQAALQGRRLCRTERGGCGRQMTYTLSTRLGVCNNCAFPEDADDQPEVLASAS